MLEKTFGKALNGKVYTDRAGAYAIIYNNEDKISAVKTSTGYFLLGGGIEEDETHEDCIIRECMEEAGLSVNVKQFVCKGDNYQWSDTLKYYMHGIGYFYLTDLIKHAAEAIEKDHELCWLSMEDCCEKLFLEHQVWAVQQSWLLRK